VRKNGDGTALVAASSQGEVAAIEPPTPFAEGDVPEVARTIDLVAMGWSEPIRAFDASPDQLVVAGWERGAQFTARRRRRPRIRAARSSACLAVALASDLIGVFGDSGVALAISSMRQREVSCPWRLRSSSLSASDEVLDRHPARMAESRIAAGAGLLALSTPEAVEFLRPCE